MLCGFYLPDQDTFGGGAVEKACHSSLLIIQENILATQQIVNMTQMMGFKGQLSSLIYVHVEFKKVVYFPPATHILCIKSSC